MVAEWADSSGNLSHVPSVLLCWCILSRAKSRKVTVRRSLRRTVCSLIVLAGLIPALAGGVASASTSRIVGHIAAGARVDLYEWPSSTVLSRLRPGQRVPWRHVATSTAGASGTFSFSAPKVTNGQTINLEAISTDGGFGSFSFPWRLGSSRVIGNLRFLHSAVPSDPLICEGPYFDQSYGNQWDILAKTHAATNEIQQGYTYDSGQSSILGVATSASSDYGTWSASGTMGWSSSSEESFPVHGGNLDVRYWSEFTYGLYQFDCATRGGESVYYQTQVSDYAGGANETSPTDEPAADYCVFQEAGSHFYLNVTTSDTFSQGLNIAAVIGIDLSTQTGYSTGGEVQFWFTDSRDLCGENNYPASSDPGPGQLVAEA